jgi:hypothetical protein
MLIFLIQIECARAIPGKTVDGNVDGATSTSTSNSASYSSDITLVAGTGLGGAVLGLSTLSFEDEPGQHLSHILTGASIGIMIGVAIIIFEKVSQGPEMIEARNGEGFATRARLNTNDNYFFNRPLTYELTQWSEEKFQSRKNYFQKISNFTQPLTPVVTFTF